MRPVSSPAAVQRPAEARRAAFVPSSRCQTARFTASTAQHLSFRRRMSASRVLALPFLFCPFACRRISARLTDAAAGLSPSPWRQRPARPDEGRVERRQAHSLALSRLRGATTAPLPGATGTPLGAPPWRFSAGDPWCRLRQWDTGDASDVSAPSPEGLADGIPDLPERRFRAACRGTPLPAPPSGSSPETPLRSEDGNLYSIASCCSQ